MTIVEVLGRGGRVAHRVRLDRLPATIGRGYGNDVILDDPYADAVHARLVAGELGGLAVEDLDSANGLYGGAGGARVRTLLLAPGATFRVGHTVLRVADASLAVAPALRDSSLGSRARRVVHTRTAAAVATLAGAPLLATLLFLGDADNTAASDYWGALFAMLAVVAAWAGGWALATRLATGHSRYLAHLTVAWIVLVGVMVAASLSGWVAFLLAGRGAVAPLQLVAEVAMMAAVLYAHLAVASSLPRARRAVIGAGVALGLVGLAALVPEDLADDYGDISVTTPLKPAPASWIAAVEPDSFLARAAALQAEVDEEATAGK